MKGEAMFAVVNTAPANETCKSRKQMQLIFEYVPPKNSST